MLEKAIMIQARMASTRLPGKILLPFFGDTGCLELLIDRLRERINLPVIILTSTNVSDNVIEGLADRSNVLCYRGDEHNVLLRFESCAKKFGVKNIIRICSDNPFLDMDDLNYLVNFDMQDFDYVSFKVQGIPSIKTHYGLWAERVSLKALSHVSNSTNDPIYQEHVTNYIYHRPELFNVFLIDRTQEVPLYPVRLTLDTKEDFEVLSNIYASLKNANKGFNKKNIFEIISRNIHYQNAMDMQIQKNSK